jgi:ATP-dependent Lon protease
MKDPKRKKIKVSSFDNQDLSNQYPHNSNLQSPSENEICDDSSDYIPKPTIKRGRKRSKPIDSHDVPNNDVKIEKIDLDVKLYVKRIREKSRNDDYFRKLSLQEQIHLLKSEDIILSTNSHEMPLRYRIIESVFLNNVTKNTLLHKLDYFDKLTPNDNEYSKLCKWVETLDKLPFNNYIQFPITKSYSLPEIQSFMNNCTSILNSTIYGQTRAKNKILELIAQRISNPQSTCSIIALTGPPGVGKTSLVKNGISKALKYPFSFTALGGATDASFLEGHAYTYEGSHYGRIVEMLIETQCMNPILFFDELDKISDSPKGAEIAGILTHITDTTQNMNFHDKYLFGFNIDLSKCILFFSLNDLSLINPILRDRLTIVEFDKYGVQDKIHIAKNHLIHEVTTNIGLNCDDYVFNDEVIKYIIDKTSKDEDGIRNLKRGFENIFMKLNYDMYMPGEKQMIKMEVKPYTFKKSDIEKLLEDGNKKSESLSSSLSMIYI